MAVSYANELSLAVITTGTEAGTWGTLTNDNFQYALTQAIGGNAPITFSSATETLTPTATNGLQDFRALFLTCSGTPGAAATLVVPAINKPYLIKNNLSGGYNLTVKIGASTGTVVPNGKTMFLYANGSDVITTNDYFSTLATAGALTVGTSASPATTTLNGNLTVGTTAVTSGTYGRAGSVVTVTSSSHGFSNGQVLYLSFSAGTGGTATTGVYTIANVTTNTFEVTDTASGSITGSPAVSITKYNNSASFNTPLTVPAAFGSSGTSGQYLISQGTGAPPKWESLTGVSGAWTVGGTFTANGNSTLGSTTASSGTYGRSGTTVTVTSNSHGFSNGQVLYLVFSAGTGGTATTGFYAISNVATNTFDITDTASGTITGSPAVSITKYNNTVTLQAPLHTFGSAGTSGYLLASQGTGAPPQWVNGVSKLTNSTDKLSVDSDGNFTSVIPSGSTLLPSFFPRAWLNFAPATYTTVNATYTWASTTCTVTSTAHGFETGDIVYLNFTSGAAAANAARIFYVVTKLTDNTFSVSGASYTQATAANVSYYLINLTTNGASGNIRRVSVGTPGAAIGIITGFAAMFTTAMPDDNYAWTGSAGQSNNSTETGFVLSPLSVTIGNWKRATAIQLGIYDSAGTYATNNVEDASLVITR